MRIAILGSGDIGGTIGRKWAEAGHSIHFGVRDPEAKAAEADKSLAEHEVLFESVPAAIEAGEVVLLAVPSAAVEKITEQHGQALAGKVVIDATNDFGRQDMSALDVLADDAPGATVYRAFNSLGWENYADPEFGGTRADLFYCGSANASGSTLMEGLIQDVGLRPVRVGGLEMSQVLDNMTRLWAALAMNQERGRHLAFKLLE